MAKSGADGRDEATLLGEKRRRSRRTAFSKLARGSETVVLLIGRKGRMEMEILDRFFVKGENDSDVENYRSGYAISFI